MKKYLSLIICLIYISSFGQSNNGEIFIHSEQNPNSFVFKRIENYPKIESLNYSDTALLKIKIDSQRIKYVPENYPTRSKFTTSKIKHTDDTDPLYLIDNAKIKNNNINKVNPKEIATVELLKDKIAAEKYGDEGKNGVVLIYTKNYARTIYWNYFKTKSADYFKAIPTVKDEKNVIYILNDKVLEKDFEGDLFKINDSNFIELKVIDKKQLIKDFNITDKKWGIVIKTESGK